MKVCTRCGEKKSLKEFGKSKKNWCRTCYKEYHSTWCKNNKDKRKISQARGMMNHILRHPEQICASQVVGWAKICGELIPEPCECGSKDVQGHHDNYKRKYWLQVRWLCKACHDAWHKLREYNPKTKGFDLI